MDIKIYFRQLRELFIQAADEAIAEQQRRYLRYQFDYYGLKAPQWFSLVKQFIDQHGLPDLSQVTTLVELCFEDPHRELHYAAIEIVQKQQKKIGSNGIELIEHMIITKSWWDTVDWLAKLAGIHFINYPADRLPVTRRWMDSNHLWLQRSAIIFQLLYREKTDFALLTNYILQVKSSREFFLQKAAGWALRQYSKYNAQAVQDFVNLNNLAPLTRREALKWLGKHS